MANSYVTWRRLLTMSPPRFAALRQLWSGEPYQHVRIGITQFAGMMASIAIERSAQTVVVDVDETIVPQRINRTADRVFERGHQIRPLTWPGNHNRGRTVTQCRKMVHAM
jgi:hypothetical protein